MSKWTPEQEEAISRRGRSLLVSAAAGAGKTAVLVERIIRRILDPAEPVDIDRLLVVTFTNAAAQEMKERIGLALAERSGENPEDINIRKQLLLLGKVSISTLHSFCLEIIRQYYYEMALPEELSLDPRFRIADDVEADLLKLETMEELFEDKYALEDTLFLQLVESFGGERDDRLLQDLILKLYEFSRSQPDPVEWLNNVALTFCAGLEDAAIQDLFLNMAESIVIPLEEALDRIKEAAELASGPGGPAVYLDNLREEAVQLDEILSLAHALSYRGSWTVLFKALAEIRFASLKPCRDKDVDAKTKEAVQELRKEAKEIVQRLQKEFVSRTPDEYLQDMREMAPFMGALCKLVEEFSARFLQAKFARNLLDFADIEHFALNLLRTKDQDTWIPSPLAQKIKNKYEEVLIDEYQDINNVQEAILALVSRSDEKSFNLFMVGDVKQSIYGFRLAEPGLFLAKYNKFCRCESTSDALEEKIVLARNFRSREFILDGVNYIFKQLMNVKLGGIPYDSDAELVYAAGYPPLIQEELPEPQKAVEFHLIDGRENLPEQTDRQEDGEPEENITAGESEDLDALQMEARVMGRRIVEMMGSTVWDRGKGIYRPVQYRDIVVLFRSIKGTAATLLEEFRLMGIPAYAETGTGYLGAQEVQTMLALLNVIDNPRQDIPLAAVLRSAIVGMTAGELTGIRLIRPRGDLFDAVRLAARKDEGELRLKLRKFIRHLRYWRTFSRRNSLVELIWLLFRETGYFEYVGALPGGKQRQANLRALHDRAKEYENTTMKGLFKFLRFMEKLKENKNDLGAARALGEKEDVVRIMSIHKSKGLEFPIVFLAGLGKRFNHADLKEDILVDKDLGLGPVWVDYEKRLKYPTLAKIAIKNKLKRELLAEEIRILYVAMTRAGETLVLVGALKNIERKLKKWTRVLQHQEWELPAVLMNRASCFWDWLGPCLLRHREGKILRELTGREESLNIFDDASSFCLYLWNSRDIHSKPGDRTGDNTVRMEKVRSMLPLEGTAEQRLFVQNRLGWIYPWADLSAIPAKLSVTEIKNRYYELFQDRTSSNTFFEWRKFASKPRFKQKDSKLSASEAGLAVHLVMRHLDSAQSWTEEKIKEQVDIMVSKKIITPEQGENVDTQAVAAFFRSPLAARIRNSAQVWREMPFTLAIPASELYGERQTLLSEKIVVQGTIDCLFAEEDGYILVDYKTDFITRDTIDLFKNRYKVQMELYKRAVETIFKKPVRKKILYSFCLGETVII